MARVSNRQARSYVENKQEFVTHNTTMFAEHDLAANTYTVYSYGRHFPMYVYDYDTAEWWGNGDKYSPTTSRHQSAARPHDVAHWTDTHTLQNIAAHGVLQTVKYRLAA